MNKLLLLTIVPLLLSIAAMMEQCSQNLAGAGSETTNSITGSILSRDGSAAAHTPVKLFCATYDPAGASGQTDPVNTATDASGVFRFAGLAAGTYALVARDAASTTIAQITGITIGSRDTSATLPPERLQKPGTITTRFSTDGLHTGEYIYLPGTDLFAPVDSTGTAVLDGVPPGPQTILIHAQSENVKRNILRDTVTVGENDTLTISNPAWRFTRKITLNTSPGGAGIGSTLYHFPVLLRLSADNFIFSEAHTAGDDIIFTKSDNTPLPFEIDRWDATARLADIWIGIDTLYGNSTSQSIQMYWGNPAASRNSAGSPVFDTALGFEGVWHLSENSGDSAIDATANHYSGIASGMDETSFAEGIIGQCRVFDGTKSYLTMPNTAGSTINFPLEGTFTISAWVYSASTDERSHVILSKGNTQYFLWYTPIHLNTPLWEFAGYRNHSGWDLSTQPARSGEWVLLTGVREGKSQRLYVNGEPTDSLIDFALTGSRDESFDLMVGRFAQVMASPNNNEGYCYFNGMIDEIRISSKACDANWIRLCYLNQRQNNKLFNF